MKDISLVRHLPAEPRVPFISLRKIAAVLSILALIGSIFLFSTRGLNYGIDFTGGTVVEADFGAEPESERVKNILANIGYGGAQVQSIKAPEIANVEYSYARIALPLQEESVEEGAAAQQRALRAATDELMLQFGMIDEVPPSPQFILEETGDDATPEQEAAYQAYQDVRSNFVKKQDVVGSKVSGELRQKGAIAILLALGMVLLYIWFRFEWQFGLGAVVALFHDVLLTIGVFSLTQIEFNLSIIAAILTIVGYSLNDTVIVYDRIRENLRKYKKMVLPEVLNLSINDTLSRTILTSLTTLTALIALYFLGGSGLRGFSFAMIWGVFVGTYSSIFVASPMLMLLKLKRGANTGKDPE